MEPQQLCILKNGQQIDIEPKINVNVINIDKTTIWKNINPQTQHNIILYDYNNFIKLDIRDLHSIGGGSSSVLCILPETYRPNKSITFKRLADLEFFPYVGKLNITINTNGEVIIDSIYNIVEGAVIDCTDISNLTDCIFYTLD